MAATELARAVAVIMDGNGRWAEQRGLPVAEGHRAGTKALRRTVEAAIDLGVESLAVYAFSTENWSRPIDEVEDLMEIFGETIERELPDLAAQGVRTRFIGRRDRAPDELRALLDRRWTVEDIKSIQPKDIEIKKIGTGYNMRAWYRAEAPFVANVSLVADFDKTVNVKGP